MVKALTSLLACSAFFLHTAQAMDMVSMPENPETLYWQSLTLESEKLREVLRKQSTHEHVKIFDLSQDLFPSFVMFLNQYPDLCSLTFSYQEFTSETFKGVMEALRNHKNLTKLSLEILEVDTVDLSPLSALLKGSPLKEFTLKTPGRWGMGGMEDSPVLDDKRFQDLMDAIEENTSLTRLQFKYLSLNLEKSHVFAKAMKNNKSLLTVELNLSKASRRDVEVLGMGVGANHFLKKISLTGRGISRKDYAGKFNDEWEKFESYLDGEEEFKPKVKEFMKEFIGEEENTEELLETSDSLFDLIEKIRSADTHVSKDDKEEPHEFIYNEDARRLREKYKDIASKDVMDQFLEDAKNEYAHKYPSKENPFTLYTLFKSYKGSSSHYFLKGLQENTTLEEIYISMIDDDTCLDKLLLNNKNLRKLGDINPFDKPHENKDFFIEFAKNTTLKKISFDGWTTRQKDFASSLSLALMENQGLEAIDLDGGLDSLKEFSASIANHKTLKKISLRNIRFPRGDLDLFAQSILKNKSLEEISLRRIHLLEKKAKWLDGQEVKAFFEKIKDKKITVSLKDSRVANISIEDFTDGDIPLWFLERKDGGFIDDDLPLLGKFLEGNQTVENLSFNYFGCTVNGKAVGLRAFKDSLEKNNTLRFLEIGIIHQSEEDVDENPWLILRDIKKVCKMKGIKFRGTSDIL